MNCKPDFCWPITMCALILMLLPIEVSAEITDSAADGFKIVLKQATRLDSETACRAAVEDFAKWYDASHSYGGQPKNLSLDLDRHCMLEKLQDDGFVRHMEIVFYRPGRVLRMTGGLGPLQAMGANGALTFSFEEVDAGTEVTWTYVVTGSSIQRLDRIAGPVHGVLTEQLTRLTSYCDEIHSSENKD